MKLLLNTEYEEKRKEAEMLLEEKRNLQNQIDTICQVKMEALQARHDFRTED